MGKEILMFGNIEIEKINISTIRLQLLRRCRYLKKY